MSSRIVRNVFDQLRNKGFPSANLPFHQVEWWDKTYDTMNGRVQEWGEVDFNDLIYHDYCSYDESYLSNKFKGSLKRGCLADEDVAGQAYNKPGNHLLVLGGGTSNLSRQFHEGGWPNVLDIDFSQKVIDLNREKYDKYFTNLKFECVDARYMRMNILAKTLYAKEISKNSLFDVCIDKGVVDGLWCSGVDASKQISLISQSVSSVLKPGGKFLTLSYTSPDLMNPLLLNAMNSNNINNDKSNLDRNGNLVKSSMWSQVEIRKLGSFYMYILERSKKEFSEGSGGDSSEKDENESAKFETWRRTQRNRRK